jgi:guanosine-diphosphatase
MFSTRKYTPLPTNANGNGTGARKRSGGGMTAWKKLLLVGGGVTLVILAFGGYHGVGRSNGGSLEYGEDSESLSDLS